MSVFCKRHDRAHVRHLEASEGRYEGDEDSLDLRVLGPLGPRGHGVRIRLELETRVVAAVAEIEVACCGQLSVASPNGSIALDSSDNTRRRAAGAHVRSGLVTCTHRVAVQFGFKAEP